MSPRKAKAAPAPALTAHTGYDPAGLPGYRRPVYHAVLDQDVHVGSSEVLPGIWRNAGEALCGARGPFPDAPEGLFPPMVTCPSCLRAADRDHITINGQPDMLGRP